MVATYFVLICNLQSAYEISFQTLSYIFMHQFGGTFS